MPDGARPELLRAIATLAERPSGEHSRIATALGLPALPEAAAYTELFALQLYPYASVYVGAEGMLGGDARDRVAGFWRALHLAPPAEADHLATLLALYAELSERAASERDARGRAALASARDALAWEHLLPWVPPYARKVRAIGDACYRAWAALLERALHDRSRDGIQALPLHLRSAPALADPREAGAEAFIASLLAPVRSGFILVRHDLGRAAHELELGLRQSERRFALSSMFAQDRDGMLGWLAVEAETASRAHAAARRWPGVIRNFWSERAASSARLLRSLRGAL